MALEMLEFLLIALVSATALIVLAKFVLQNLIRRPVDYYEKIEAAEEAELTAAVFDAIRNGSSSHKSH